MVGGVLIFNHGYLLSRYIALSGIFIFKSTTSAFCFLLSQALINVIPAQAGIYKRLIFLDSHLRGSEIHHPLLNKATWNALSGAYFYSTPIFIRRLSDKLQF